MTQINNLNVKELFKLGFQNQKQKNFQRAIELYEKVIKIDPTIVFTHYNLGIIYEQLGDIEKAEENYQEAIKVNPSFIYSYNNLGIMSHQKGQKENAIKYFKQVIKIDPKYYNGYSNLGLVYASLGMYDQALNNYLETLALDENNLVAKKSIIFLLTYYESDNRHYLIKSNNDLRQLQNKFALIELLKTDNLNYVLNNSLKIIKKISINILKPIKKPSKNKPVKIEEKIDPSFFVNVILVAYPSLSMSLLFSSGNNKFNSTCLFGSLVFFSSIVRRDKLVIKFSHIPFLRG